MFSILGCVNLDSNGFDKKTKIHSVTNSKFNENGIDIRGFNKDGWNVITNSEYDKNGIDIRGFKYSDNWNVFTNSLHDVEGYDKKGWNTDSWNRLGINYITGTYFDYKGYDINGYNINGWNVMNINKETNSKFDREGYDYSGYSILNWNKEGINKETKSKFDKEGYDINGYNLNGFNQENVNQETKTLYDTEGYNVIGFNKEGYNRRDFDKEGINKETKSKFDKEGYDVNGYNKYNIKNDYMKYFSITTDKFDNSSKIENIKIKKNKSLEDIYSDYTINMIELYKSYNSFTATDMEKILFKYKVESAPLELREKFLITKMSKIIWVDSMILTASNSKNIILNMKIYPDKAESSAKKIIILIDNNKTYTFTEVKTNKE